MAAENLGSPSRPSLLLLPSSWAVGECAAGGLRKQQPTPFALPPPGTLPAGVPEWAPTTGRGWAGQAHLGGEGVLGAAGQFQNVLLRGALLPGLGLADSSLPKPRSARLHRPLPVSGSTQPLGRGSTREAQFRGLAFRSRPTAWAEAGTRAAGVTAIVFLGKARSLPPSLPPSQGPDRSFLAPPSLCPLGPSPWRLHCSSD